MLKKKKRQAKGWMRKGLKDLYNLHTAESGREQMKDQNHRGLFERMVRQMS